MPIKDLTGQTFGRLTVVGLLPERTKTGQTQWRCRCSCGGWVLCVIGGNLTSGNTTSCGCRKSEVAVENGRTQLTHGMTKKTGNWHYKRWDSMKQRTGNRNAPNYKDYGERGVKVYPGWFNNFVAFKAWLDENLGPCPEGSSLDRIDANGHYCPGNIRWATNKQQRGNRR